MTDTNNEILLHGCPFFRFKKKWKKRYCVIYRRSSFSSSLKLNMSKKPSLKFNEPEYIHSYDFGVHIFSRLSIMLICTHKVWCLTFDDFDILQSWDKALNIFLKCSRYFASICYAPKSSRLFAYLPKTINGSSDSKHLIHTFKENEEAGCSTGYYSLTSSLFKLSQRHLSGDGCLHATKDRLCFVTLPPNGCRPSLLASWNFNNGELQVYGTGHLCLPSTATGAYNQSNHCIFYLVAGGQQKQASGRHVFICELASKLSEWIQRVTRPASFLYEYRWMTSIKPHLAQKQICVNCQFIGSKISKPKREKKSYSFSDAPGICGNGDQGVSTRYEFNNFVKETYQDLPSYLSYQRHISRSSDCYHSHDNFLNIQPRLRCSSQPTVHLLQEYGTLTNYVSLKNTQTIACRDGTNVTFDQDEAIQPVERRFRSYVNLAPNSEINLPHREVYEQKRATSPPCICKRFESQFVEVPPLPLEYLTNDFHLTSSEWNHPVPPAPFLSCSLSLLSSSPPTTSKNVSTKTRTLSPPRPLLDHIDGVEDGMQVKPHNATASQAIVSCTPKLWGNLRPRLTSSWSTSHNFPSIFSTPLIAKQKDCRGHPTIGWSTSSGGLQTLSRETGPFGRSGVGLTCSVPWDVAPNTKKPRTGHLYASREEILAAASQRSQHPPLQSILSSSSNSSSDSSNDGTGGGRALFQLQDRGYKQLNLTNRSMASSAGIQNQERYLDDVAHQQAITSSTIQRAQSYVNVAHFGMLNQSGNTFRSVVQPITAEHHSQTAVAPLAQFEPGSYIHLSDCIAGGSSNVTTLPRNYLDFANLVSCAHQITPSLDTETIVAENPLRISTAQLASSLASNVDPWPCSEPTNINYMSLMLPLSPASNDASSNIVVGGGDHMKIFSTDPLTDEIGISPPETVQPLSDPLQTDNDEIEPIDSIDDVTESTDESRTNYVLIDFHQTQVLSELVHDLDNGEGLDGDTRREQSLPPTQSEYAQSSRTTITNYQPSLRRHGFCNFFYPRTSSTETPTENSSLPEDVSAASRVRTTSLKLHLWNFRSKNTRSTH